MSPMKIGDLAELIPASVGKGTIRKQFQNRRLRQWALLAVSGLTVFYQKSFHLPSNVRVAALGLLFPGAGFVACANVAGGISFVLTVLLLPLTLLAWFGAGGLAFPLGLWILSALGAYFAAGESVFEYAGIITGVALAAFIGYFNRFSAKASKAGVFKRETRNQFIATELRDIEASSVKPPPENERELSLDDLRMVQYAIDQARRDHDDWTNFGIIDQFQTSALRYQLYELGYIMGAYQGIYTPNFHGYLSEAHRNIIEKSFTKKVMNFWKWETLWGKFSTNYDPVVEDNIMVTGFLLQAMMLYIANTGDTRYEKPNSMKFHVTDKDIYSHDVHSMDESLVRQWSNSEYCLFPCEPNWIYTPCNFQGMTGQVLYDRVYGTNHLNGVIDKFEQSLDENFTETDGSILPIRSALTGFTIPGLCGALTDCFNALLCRGYLDHIARRMWCIFRHECVRLDSKTGELRFEGLVGADQMDPGTYKHSEYNIYSIVSIVAGEFGDEKLRVAAIDALKKNVGLETTETGAKRLTAAKASLNMNSCMVRGVLLRCEDWKNLVSKGPSKTTLAGPILNEVPYPGVIVAKARSHTSRDLDLVLYPSAAAGSFTFGVERLEPKKTYDIGGKMKLAADKDGKLKFSIPVEGRTAVLIAPVD